MEEKPQSRANMSLPGKGAKILGRAGWMIAISIRSLFILWAAFSGSLVVFGIVYLVFFDPYFFPIDDCIDQGGVWNYGHKVCEK